VDLEHVQVPQGKIILVLDIKLIFKLKTDEQGNVDAIRPDSW